MATHSQRPAAFYHASWYTGRPLLEGLISHARLAPISNLPLPISLASNPSFSLPSPLSARPLLSLSLYLSLPLHCPFVNHALFVNFYSSILYFWFVKSEDFYYTTEDEREAIQLLQIIDQEAIRSWKSWRLTLTWIWPIMIEARIQISKRGKRAGDRVFRSSKESGWPNMGALPLAWRRGSPREGAGELRSV